MNGDQKFKGIVIITNQNSIWPPCGACRQAMYQFCKDNPRDFEIVSFASNGVDHKRWSLDKLLPDPFNLQGMDANKNDRPAYRRRTVKSICQGLARNSR